MQHYQIRMLDIQGIRNVYIPLIEREIEKWNHGHIPWTEDIEHATDWVIKEVFQLTFQCPVIDHYKSDYGQYLFDQLSSIVFDMSPLLDEIKHAIRGKPLKHLKIMVVGSLLFVAILQD